jgi:hypothetical protein
MSHWEQTRLFLRNLSESLYLGVAPLGAPSWFVFGDQSKVVNRYCVPIQELVERGMVRRSKDGRETYSITAFGLTVLAALTKEARRGR